MTDSELLELAAKAAGIAAQWDCPDRGMMTLTPSGVDTMTWNPLADDGDALRLAVKLGLLGSPRTQLEWILAIGDDDPYAATRRAIVRAAAKIGGMK